MNKAVVRVLSRAGLSQGRNHRRAVRPDSQVVRSEQRGQEKASGVNGTTGGVPGVESNVPQGTDTEGSQTSSTSNQTKNETVNYEISRTVSRIVEPIGTIKKLSVAVLVDGTYEAAKTGEGDKTGLAETPKKYAPRSEEEMKRIEDIVKKAMGYNADRQDQVEVVNIQFGFGVEEPVGAAIEATPDATKVWMPYVRYAVGGALFVLLLFFVVRPLMTMLVTSSTGPHDGTDDAGASRVSRSGRSRARGKAAYAGSRHGQKQSGRHRRRRQTVVEE